MSALIEKLSAGLRQAAGEWEWRLSYAPKPGQQRIKFTAQKPGCPETCQAIVLTEELCKTLTTEQVVRHVLAVIPAKSRGRMPRYSLSDEKLPMQTKPQTSQLTLEEQYSAMRKSYQSTVSDLKRRPVAGRSSSWLSFLAFSLQHLHISRR